MIVPRMTKKDARVVKLVVALHHENLKVMKLVMELHYMSPRMVKLILKLYHLGSYTYMSWWMVGFIREISKFQIRWVLPIRNDGSWLMLW